MVIFIIPLVERTTKSNTNIFEFEVCNVIPDYCSNSFVTQEYYVNFIKQHDILQERKMVNDIFREFIFKDFKESLQFINKIGVLAEEQNHHPELFNVYNKVNIRLSTHDANGVTDKDFNLAKAIDLI